MVRFHLERNQLRSKRRVSRRVALAGLFADATDQVPHLVGQKGARVEDGNNRGLPFAAREEVL